MRALDVFIEGFPDPVGRLIGDTDGALTFAYSSERMPQISLSLPVRDAPFRDVAARGFFANLLNENNQMQAVMERHQVSANDIAGLLFHLGRDLPGALSCVPSGEGAGKQPGMLEADYEEVSDRDLERIMTALREYRHLPAEIQNPSPLAGVQGKIALAKLGEDRFGLPAEKGGRPLNVPTTHILKVPRRGEEQLVDQEHALMRMAAKVLPHPVAETEIFERGDARGLLIKRYDRVIANGTVTRIHQEDFCQALGLGPRLKYQRDGTDQARFTAARVADILKQTQAATLGMRAFFLGTLFNLAVGNSDNHAKNHGLLYTKAAEGRTNAPELAPFYDIVPIQMSENVNRDFSFSIGNAVKAEDLTAEDIERFAMDIGYARLVKSMKNLAGKMIMSMIDGIDVIPGKPMRDMMLTQMDYLADAGLPIEVPAHDWYGHAIRPYGGLS